MVDRRDARGPVFLVALLAVLILGMGLRLADPLSTPSLGAEDPFTHVVFTKEHLRRGYFDDVPILGTSLYPPGLHAFTGIVAPLTGVGLYEFARFAPSVLGTLAVLGAALLGRRLGGDAAGLATGFLVAVIPEAIVRTNLFFPTVLDVALLPAFLLTFLLASERNWGGLVFYVALVAVLAYSHPWVVPIIAGMGAVYVSLRIVRGGSFLTETDETDAPTFAKKFVRLLIPVALVAGAVAIGSVARWDQGNTSFTAFLADAGKLSLLASVDLAPPLLFAFLTVLLVLGAAPVVLILASVGELTPRVPKLLRLGVGIIAAGGVVWTAWRLAQNPPVTVVFPQMIGPVPALMAFTGAALALLRPTRLGDIGLACAAVVFPFTVFQFFNDVFDAKHWPARAVVYLIIGIALLSANVVAHAVNGLTRWVESRRPTGWLVPVATITALMLVAGAVVAKPAKPKDWYRLYPVDEFDAFERTNDMLLDDPSARIVVASWQPALIFKTIGDPGQVRYAPRFYNETSHREEIIDEAPGRTTYVLVDRFVDKRIAKGDTSVDLSFLETSRFTHLETVGQFRLYKYEM